MRPALCFFACLLLASGLALWLVPKKPSTRTSSAREEARAASPERPLILTGHASTYCLAKALSEGTSLEVAWAWPKGTVWSDQTHVAVSARAAQATAVITLRCAAPEDALFAAVRALQLAVIEIDATVAPDRRTPVVRVPADGARAAVPVAPLTLENTTRMAEVIARDLARLHPRDAPRIGENARRVKERLFRLRAETEAKLAEVAALEVVLTAPEFAGLAEELGLSVRPADDPEAIVALANRAPPVERPTHLTGAKRQVVVLETFAGEPADPEHFFKAMEKNLAAIVSAFAGQSAR